MLVDTSVWVDHFRHGDAALANALESDQVWMHAYVLGELACGSMPARIETLSLLNGLASLPLCSDKEVLFFIEQYALMGRGIGYIDMHLLAAAKLTGVSLWTRDKRLRIVAADLGLAYVETKH